MWQIPDIKRHVKNIRDPEEQERVLQEYTHYKEVEAKYEKLIPFESIVKVHGPRG